MPEGGPGPQIHNMLLIFQKYEFKENMCGGFLE